MQTSVRMLVYLCWEQIWLGVPAVHAAAERCASTRSVILYPDKIDFWLEIDLCAQPLPSQTQQWVFLRGEVCWDLISTRREEGFFFLSGLKAKSVMKGADGSAANKTISVRRWNLSYWWEFEPTALWTESLKLQLCLFLLMSLSLGKLFHRGVVGFFP